MTDQTTSNEKLFENEGPLPIIDRQKEDLNNLLNNYQKRERPKSPATIRLRALRPEIERLMEAHVPAKDIYAALTKSGNDVHITLSGVSAFIRMIKSEDEKIKKEKRKAAADAKRHEDRSRDEPV
jgi:hypothetical protein